MSYQEVGLDIPALITTAQKIGSTSLKVLEDPYLPELLCHVNRLNAIQEKRDPGPACRRTPKDLPGGIGLEDTITPIRIFTSVKQQPVWGYASVALIVGGIAGIGYFLGKASK